MYIHICIIPIYVYLYILFHVVYHGKFIQKSLLFSKLCRKKLFDKNLCEKFARKSSLVPWNSDCWNLVDLLLHLSYAFSRTCKTIVYLIFLRTRVSMRSTLEGGKTSDRTPLVGIDKNYDMECYQSPGKHFHGGSSRMILPEKYQ